MLIKLRKNSLEQNQNTELMIFFIFSLQILRSETKQQ